jgi:hypothetical protein
MKPHTGSIWGLNLAAVKFKTVKVTKMPLKHEINNMGMICFEKLGLTKDFFFIL